MKQIIRGIKIIALIIFATTYTGCEDDDEVLPAIEAGFTFTINQDTGTVTFINTSESANSYQWDFGDGTTSEEVNPIKTYETGNYTVILEATNNAGATSTFESDIVVNIPLVVAFPISFDNPQVNYEANTFNGASFRVVPNPDQSGANPDASNVGEITNSGAAFEGIFFDLGMPLDLTTDKTVKFLFWSTSPIDVLLKLENGTGADVETVASHGGTGWEEIFFTFDSANSYNTITIFVDGPGTTAGTFYIDGIEQINTADIPCLETDLQLPIDFDCNGIDYAAKIAGNVNFTVVDNPEVSGINNVDTKVGQITNVGANFENAFFNLDVPVDFATDKGISVKIFSDQALPVLLKFEDGTEGDTEDTQNHTGSGWEELTFTLNSNGSYNDMVLFIDGPGTAAGTFYVDDFTQVSGNVGTPCTPETEENIDPANGDLNWTFLSNDETVLFDAFGNTAGAIVDNPLVDGVNASCKVQQFVKTAGCQTFAGLGTELITALDFTNSSTNKVFTMKVFAETQVTDVTFRLERLPFPDVDPAIERVETITQVGEWQELTFDFSDVSTGTYKSLIIYFERNQECDGDVYYFDDIKQMSGSGGGGPMAFDDGLLTNGDFQTVDGSGNVTEWIIGVGTDPAPTTLDGENRFYSVEVPVANPAAPFATNVSQKLEIVDGTTYILSFDAWTDAGTGSRNIIAGIGLSGGSFANNSVPVGITSTRDTYQLTLLADGFGAPDARVLFDLAAEAGQVNIDNVSLFEDTGSGGGGGGGGGSASNVAQNGDFETGDFTDWAVFENGGSITIDGAVNNGGSWSGKIVATGSSSAGSNATLKQERKGAGTVSAGDTIEIKFDYLGGDTSAPGSVINIQIFGEIAAGGVSFVENAPAPTASTTWMTYTYTYTIPNNADVSGGVTLQFNSPCGAVDGCTSTINLDNVEINIQ